MIKLKKIVVLVIMALMVTLCACGNGGGDSTDSGQTDVQLKDIRETVDVSSIPTASEPAIPAVSSPLRSASIRSPSSPMLMV